MPKFYRPRGSEHPAVLWDAEANKPKYEFFGGICETEDPATIELLTEMGFATEPISPNVQQQMEVMRDIMRPQPPPPPAEKTVPKIEPKVKVPAAAKAAAKAEPKED